MPPKTEVAKKATFDTDDKRAQYARLAVLNHGIREKLIPKGTDVNAATSAQLTKAVDSLAGGNLLDGPGGIELIQELTKAGATDENVAKRGLTRAYAMEVRPFIRRKTLSPNFGRRSKPRAEKPAAEKKAASGKKGSASSSKKSAPQTPEPATEA